MLRLHLQIAVDTTFWLPSGCDGKKLIFFPYLVLEKTVKGLDWLKKAYISLRDMIVSFSLFCQYSHLIS